MKRVLQLAKKAIGKTSPNPYVGAVIVKNGKIIAEGWHKKCGGDHAEIDAFNNAKSPVKGATLFVNLEPCFHVGRTPPCAEAIIKSGIKKVVIAMKDPNPLTNGKSIAKLKKAGIDVKVGILENEARILNGAFIKFMTLKMPLVVGKCAQTLDGKIATRTGDSKWITSESTRQFARKLRNEFDAILVGINTVLKDNPCLNAADKNKTIKKIVLDSSLKISLKAKLFKGCSLQNCFIATTRKASKQKIAQFEKKGIQVIVCPFCKGKIDFKWLFKELAKKQIMSILIEGGAKVLGNAIASGLVDKMHIYIAPKIVGDQKALSSIDGLNISHIGKAVLLKNIEMRFLGKDIFISADILKK